MLVLFFITKKWYNFSMESRCCNMMSLTKMPKIELHCHLDGSLNPKIVSEALSVSEKMVQKNMMVDPNNIDLNTYLEKFKVPLKMLQTKEFIRRAVKDLLKAMKKETVLYAEIRFAPQLHTEKGLTMEEVVETILEEIKQESNMICNLILCMMRNAKENDNKAVIDVAAKYWNRGVVAIDLAGAEGLYPTENFENLFRYAKEKNIPFTIHAGEVGNVSSIESALQFGTKRIGHGICAIQSPSCIKHLKKEKVTLEVCPTSNVQTKAVASIKEHPIYELYKQGVKVTIHTDNRTVSNTSLTKEYELLIQHFPFTLQDFKMMNCYAIDAAFLTEEQKQKLKEKYDKAFTKFLETL